MKARKGARSVAKTPGEWPIMYHTVIELARVGEYQTLCTSGNPAEGRSALRSFHTLIKLLPKFRVHPTSQRLAQLGPVDFQGKLEELWDGRCRVYIKCKPSVDAAVATALQNLPTGH